MTHLIGIYNHNTGEQIEREMTAEELAQREAEVSAWQTKQQAKAQAEVETAAKRSVALAKLAALGLTTDDLKALGL